MNSMINEGSVLTKKDIEESLRTDSPLVSNLIDEDAQLQPNGVDFSIAKISLLSGVGTLGFSNTDRELPNVGQLELSNDSYTHLKKGCYLVEFNEHVCLPNNVMAIGRPRSSLLRMGATVNTAVWDAGFKGVSQSLLVVETDYGINLYNSARVMQVVFIKTTKHTEAYSGVYQGS